MGRRSGAALNPTATYVDSFGNRILRNGRRPKSMETRPRITKKIPNAEVGEGTGPGRLLWSF